MPALDEILNPPIDVGTIPPADRLPGALLYASAARIGGSGLDVTSLNGILASHRAGFLRKAIGYANQQREVPRRNITSLRRAPVRALSFLASPRYYTAKKWYADHAAARALATGKFDAFHGWSGDCLQALLTAKQRDIPTLIDIPTWHRNKGRRKPFITKSEREQLAETGMAKLKARFQISRQRMIAEYELADLILVASEKAAETFLAAGIAPEKLFYVSRGVDIDHYQPAVAPPIFRLVFVGALIKRKGVHHLLAAWKRLALRDAELVLVGTAHDEIKPFLREDADSSVRVTGFTRDVQAELRRATAFVFPSECEGAAKVTFEAAACGLPLITTRESSDVAVDGTNGLVIPPNDPDALADAIRYLYDHPERVVPWGQAARKRVVENFTWDHYRARLLNAYAYAMMA